MARPAHGPVQPYELLGLETGLQEEISIGIVHSFRPARSDGGGFAVLPPSRRRAVPVAVAPGDLPAADWRWAGGYARWEGPQTGLSLSIFSRRFGRFFGLYVVLVHVRIRVDDAPLAT